VTGGGGKKERPKSSPALHFRVGEDKCGAGLRNSAALGSTLRQRFAKAVIAAVTAAQVATIERIAVIVFMSAFPHFRRYGGQTARCADSSPWSTCST
jgi:hypothetical protein